MILLQFLSQNKSSNPLFKLHLKIKSTKSVYLFNIKNEEKMNLSKWNFTDENQRLYIMNSIFKKNNPDTN